jgi:hypothetical protein
MARNLVEQHLKSGMGRAAVINLLGRPDRFYYDPPARSTDGSETLNYGLGTCSGFRIDNDYLTIEFDASGRLVRAWIWQS